jgi:hypothetical protein
MTTAPEESEKRWKMVNFIIGFILGFATGGLFGLIITAVCVAASDRDKRKDQNDS